HPCPRNCADVVIRVADTTIQCNSRCGKRNRLITSCIRHWRLIGRRRRVWRHIIICNVSSNFEVIIEDYPGVVHRPPVHTKFEVLTGTSCVVKTRALEVEFTIKVKFDQPGSPVTMEHHIMPCIGNDWKQWSAISTLCLVCYTRTT